MILTKQQSAALRHDGNVLLVACPGSGKTRSILAKLLRSIDIVRDTPRRVACITYTNTAVFEIEHRLRLYGGTGDEDYCDVSTIHSFCQNSVLRHFYWRLPIYQNGYTVLPPDSEQYLAYVKEIGDKYQIGAFDRQQFELLNRRPTGEPLTPGNIPHAAAVEFWNRLERDGFIDFCNIVYWSYKLLTDYPSLARNVAARYAYVLIDEFQDTSALQVEIFRTIASQGLTEFWLVGDPEQSIYSFAGAERDLLYSFAKDIEASTFLLSGNFRSSDHVIRCAERLIPRNPPMLATGEDKDFVEKPKYTVSDDDFTAITDHFIPLVEAHGISFGDAAVLAPTWYRLMPLGKRLRDYGVPVVGPGSRLYKKSHIFADLAEQVCAYLENPQPHHIRQIEKALFTLVLNVTRKADYRFYSYYGRRVVFRLLQQGQELRHQHEGAVDWLINAADTFATTLYEEGLLSNECKPFLSESVQAIIEEMKSHKIDIANLELANLGMFAATEQSLKLLTLHKAKGREFSAVAIISLHDGWIPYHNYYHPVTQHGIDEARRLLYVGITRAERILMLFANKGEERPPCRFIQELGIQM